MLNLRSIAASWVAVWTLSACGGGGASSISTDPTLQAVARLEWRTPAPVFTASGQQHTLQVQALAADGTVLDVPVSWQSSAPAVVAVAADPSAPVSAPRATLTAQTATGASVLTATAGGRSLSAVAVVATPAAGTVVLSDAQVSGEPQATTATLNAGGLRVGSTYTVTLQTGVAAPTVGSLVFGQGGKAIAGEVVAVNGQVLTLAMVPLQRVLPQLELDLDVPLQAAPARSTSSRTPRERAQSATGRETAQAETSFSVAGFECDAEGTAGSVGLAKKEVAPLGLDTLRYRVLWNSSHKLLRLSGQPGVQFEMEPEAKVALTGKVDCKLELADIPIPLPPSIGLFLGVGFPVGVGFTVEGELPVSGVSLNLKGQAQADVVVGFDCNPDCTSLNRITPSGSITPTVNTPELALNRLDLTGQVYAWGNFEGGARWSTTLQFDAIEAQAGLKFATKVATEQAQAQSAESSGDYVLTFEAAAGPTEALGDFADLVGLILEQAKLETSVPLGRSPTASFSADKTSFKAGDDVKFQVDLNADEVQFPLQGYNVRSVRIYRKTLNDDGSFVLVLANEQQATRDQTQFTIPWLATVDSGSNISFVAFVQTKLLTDLRWQVGQVGSVAGAAASLSGSLSYSERYSHIEGIQSVIRTMSLQANVVAKDGVIALENVTGSYVENDTIESDGIRNEGGRCIIYRKQKIQRESIFTGPFSVRSTGLAVSGNTVNGLAYMRVFGSNVSKTTVTSSVQRTEGDCAGKDLSPVNTTETFGPFNTYFSVQLAAGDFQVPVVTGSDGIRRATYSASLRPSPEQSIAASFDLTGVPN